MMSRIVILAAGLLLTTCTAKHANVTPPVDPRAAFDVMESAYLRAKAQEAPPLSVPDCNNQAIPEGLRSTVCGGPIRTVPLTVIPDGGQDVTVHGSYDLTIQDIIKTLAEFDVKHADQQPFFAPVYGATNFKTEPPSIWIFNTGSIAERRSTVIHEMLHVYYRGHRLDPPEEFIDAEEVRLYDKWFPN